MIYTVFHARGSHFADFLLSETDAPRFPHDYDRVALVHASCLDEVFQKTNHIDAPWWDNPGVVLEGEPTKRSTSVGDIIKDEENRLWVVRGIGFSRLPDLGCDYSRVNIARWRMQEARAHRTNTLDAAKYAFALVAKDAPRRRQLEIEVA